VGKEPAEAALTSADITDGIIVDADINASAAIAMSKTAFSAGNGLTLSTNTLNVDAAQTTITSLLATDIKIGEDNETKIDFEDANKINFYANNAKEVELAENSLSPGTSDGTALGTTSLMWSDLFLADGGVINLNNGDVLLTHSSNTLTLTGGGLVVGVDDTGHDVKFFGATSGKYMEWDESADQLDVTGSFDVTGNSTMVGTLTVGVNDTGHDVKFFGASAGAYMEWDESADQLRIMGASADATTSTGKLLLATSLTDINANDVIGKIEFQAPHEAGGTDAIEVAAGIEAVAQGTFSSSVNSTDLVFKTGHSEAATEKFRFTSQGELGIGGTNYGTSGQVLQSGGAGAAPSWADAAAGGGSIDLVADGSISAGDRVAITAAGKAQTVAATQTGVSAGTNATNINSTGQSGEFGEFAGYADPDAERFVLFYNDGGNSNYSTCIVVDLSNDGNDTFSEGSEVVFNSNNASAIRATYDTNVDRGLVVYENSSSDYKARVVSVSGSTPSFGTEAEIDGVNGAAIDVCFDSTTDRIACGIFRWDSGESNERLFINVLTITGGSTNTVAIGAQTQVGAFDNAGGGSQSRDLRCVADPDTGRVIFTFANGTDNGCDYFVATITGGGTNTIAAGTVAEVGSGIGNTDSNFYQCLAYDTVTNKVIHTCYNGSAGRGEARIGTVTGGGTNTVSWGSAVVLNKGGSDGFYDHGIFADPDSGIIYIFGEDYSATNGTDLVQFMECKVDGTSLAILARRKIYTTYIEGAVIAKGGQGNKVCAFMEEGNSLYAICPELTKNAYSYIGIANSAISDTATGTIQLAGSQATNQSSLSAGFKYYVDFDGSLNATDTGFAYVGTASAATTIILDGARA